MLNAAFGQTLLLIGVVIIGIGLLMIFAPNIPFLGRLPGDVSWQQGNLRVYVPIATSIVLSIILTVVLNLVAAVRR